MVNCRAFGEYTLYTIENRSGAMLRVTDLGASIQGLLMPDRNGILGDVVLGYDSDMEYLTNDGFVGATAGRYANRIAGALFRLNGKEYKLTANEGRNTLHGGKGLHLKRFSAQPGENSVLFEIKDPDGSDGFPGNICISVRYTLTESNEVIIDYSAVSDKDTVINLTNHSYFNLSCGGTILDHELKIDADYYLPVDDELIPTGEIRPVDNTDYDFRQRRMIEKPFYDSCFALNKNGCAELYDTKSGRLMTVTTDLPGMQLYAGGSMGRRKGKNGAEYGANSGVCFETQFFPDTPNKPEFPSCLLKAGEKFESRTVYKFSIK